MNKSRIITLAVGITVFLSIVSAFVWIFSLSGAPESKKISFGEAISKMRKKEVRQAVIKHDSLELTDRADNKFGVSIDQRDEIRMEILNAAKETGTEIVLLPAPRGVSQFIWGSNLPFYLMWALTLAVIVYAVRTLSRNKG